MIDLPTGLPMHTNELKTLLNDRLPRVQDRSEFPAQSGMLHDALADARHVKVRYDWIMEQGKEDPSAFARNLLKDKRESMKALIYSLIEAKKQSDRPYLAASIEIEKYGLQAEIDVLEYVLNG
jgi:hypothetical protein